jgi:hypothetical protein|tara:strand:- start:75 stop:350 length:276 start_codon:yes stop_codon:yes gene_type:complete
MRLSRSRQISSSKREKRPSSKNTKLSYETVMVKKNKKILWQCIEKPTGSIICEHFFKEDADSVTKHQNKHRQWEPNGGIVEFLTLGNIKDQ